jgi:hypothetical protein
MQDAAFGLGAALKRRPYNGKAEGEVSGLRSAVWTGPWLWRVGQVLELGGAPF